MTALDNGQFIIKNTGKVRGILKIMYKYYAAMKYEFKDRTVYKIALFFNSAVFALIMYVMINVWGYLYGDKNSLIAGYSYQQMIWYVILTELIWFSTRSAILTYQISDDIRTGNICSHVNKPYYYPVYILARYLGEMSFKTIAFIPIGVIIGAVFLGMFPEVSFFSAVCVIITFMLSVIINGIIRVLVGLSSFWIENTKPVIWLYEKLILIMGTVFPLELFSDNIQNILKYTPIYVISYGPARIFVKYNNGDFFKILFSQIIYMGIGYLCILIVYKKGKRRLNVNGG